VRLAFWARPEVAPEFDYIGWSMSRLHEARRFHEEMETWGEPIDTIRAGLGLSERWQRSSRRALHAIFDLCRAANTSAINVELAANGVTALFNGADSLLRTSYSASLGKVAPSSVVAWRRAWNASDNAHTGNPIHDEALRDAKRQR
jgi:hypothetical protein